MEFTKLNSYLILLKTIIIARNMSPIKVYFSPMFNCPIYLISFKIELLLSIFFYSMQSIKNKAMLSLNSEIILWYAAKD